MFVFGFRFNLVEMAQVHTFYIQIQVKNTYVKQDFDKSRRTNSVLLKIATCDIQFIGLQDFFFCYVQS